MEKEERDEGERRRKPKEEKIYLELHNVFIKFADNGRDTFFDRASFELKKAEKT